MGKLVQFFFLLLCNGQRKRSTAEIPYRAQVCSGEGKENAAGRLKTADHLVASVPVLDAFVWRLQFATAAFLDYGDRPVPGRDPGEAPRLSRSLGITN
jgi:hypothetical protein